MGIFDFAYKFKHTITSFALIIFVIVLLVLYLRIKARKKYRPSIPVMKWIRDLYTERFTPLGRLMFWVALLSFMFGMSTTAVKTFMVFSIISSMFLLSFIFSRLYKPRLTIKRYLPDRTSCGQKISPPTVVRNDTKKTYYDIILKESELPPEIVSTEEFKHYIPSLEPNEEFSLKVGLEFRKRGGYKIGGLRAETLFPFGLWTSGIALTPEHHFLVYPGFNSLENVDIPVGKRYQPGGIALTSSLGESTEFIGNREYREGDNPRNIHWRSWARTGKPVVKEFQEEYFCRIALLLDTFVPPKSSKEAFEAFEGAISIAASVADYLSRQEYVIDIFAAGPDIYYMQAGRSLAYLDNILDLLACLDVSPESPFEKITPVLLENLSLITTVICVFLDWDRKRENLVRMIASLGTAVKVIIVRNGPLTGDPVAYEGLVGKITVITSEQEKKGVGSF